MQKKDYLLIPDRTEELELPTLKTVTYNATSMNLTLDKHQYLNGGGKVVLPAITDTTKIYEIHLYVLSSTDVTITVTSADSKVKTLGTTSMVEGKVYEMLFTSYNVGYWICEIKEYN